jgi:predicted DNA repair protein MutK
LAAGSLLALLDDIATLLDDVAVMTKVAAKKTAGILGDDLALNAQQVAGVAAERELPVVWAVAKGSLVNKAILVPVALGLSAVAPWAVMPLLMLGGAFLCYEGCEKLLHRWMHGRAADEAERAALLRAIADPAVDVVAREREKIRGAIRTDFILSAEIAAITLAAVAHATFPVRLAVMVAISLVMTVGVYGLVAGIVKLDDVGAHLAGTQGPSRTAASRRRLGRALLIAAPWLMKGLAVVGTAAMFLVGGGILVHGLPWLHHAVEGLVSGAGGFMGDVLGVLLPGVVGVLAGSVLVLGVTLAKRLLRRGSPA